MDEKTQKYFEKLKKAHSALYLFDKAIQLAVSKITYEQEFKPLMDELKTRLERQGITA